MKFGDLLRDLKNPNLSRQRLDEIVRIFNEFGDREEQYKSWLQLVGSRINSKAISFPFERLHENLLSADAASWRMPFAPGYTHLLITGIGRTTATPGTAQEQSLNFTFNDDTGMNYQWSYIASRSGAAVADDQNSQSNLPFGMFNTDNCAAGSASSFFAFIPHYNGPFWKMCISMIAGQKTTTATGTETALMSGFWKNTAPITSITVVPGGGLGGNLKAGSLFTVYGMK